MTECSSKSAVRCPSSLFPPASKGQAELPGALGLRGREEALEEAVGTVDGTGQPLCGRWTGWGPGFFH